MKTIFKDVHYNHATSQKVSLLYDVESKSVVLDVKTGSCEVAAQFRCVLVTLDSELDSYENGKDFIAGLRDALTLVADNYDTMPEHFALKSLENE